MVKTDFDMCLRNDFSSYGVNLGSRSVQSDTVASTTNLHLDVKGKAPAENNLKSLDCRSLQ